LVILIATNPKDNTFGIALLKQLKSSVQKNAQELENTSLCRNTVIRYWKEQLQLSSKLFQTDTIVVDEKTCSNYMWL
jgi:hypothetical protein